MLETFFASALHDDRLDDFEAKVIALFGIAKSELQLGRIKEASDTLSETIGLYKAETNREGFYSFGSNFFSFWLDYDEPEMFEGSDFALGVCQEALDKLSERLAPEVKGWLNYIIYSIRNTFHDGSDDEEKAEINRYLLRAAALVEHPVISGNLSDYYQWEADDIPHAVKHHLTSVLWKHSKRDKSKPFSNWESGFNTYGDGGNPEPIRISKAKDRKAIHQIASEFLHSTSDPV